MTLVLIICAVCLCGMIAVILLKPQISIGRVKLGTYWLVTLLGSVVLIASGRISFKEIFSGLTADTAMNPLKILILFVCMTVLSIFLDEAGFFKYLANVVLKKTGSSQIKLFTSFYFIISLVTIFTSNDIVILTFTPFMCYFAKNAKINPMPYLISEFIAANTCSMLLIIGNPTNVYLATVNGINFFDYLLVMLLPTVFAVIAAYFVMLLIFYKSLKAPIGGCAEDIKIENKPLLIIGIIILSLATILLAVASYINLAMWLIALCAAVALIIAVIITGIIQKQKCSQLLNTLKRAPYELIPFLISMFVIIMSLHKYGVTKEVAGFFGSKNTVIVYGIASTLFANIINNIPMSVLFSSILQSGSLPAMNEAIYAVIVGSNIGAFLTPIGALAGIMWINILKDNKIEFSFFRFAKFGFVIAVPTLFAALGGLMLSALMV